MEMDWIAFLQGMATGGAIGILFWIYALGRYFPKKFKNARTEISQEIEAKEKKYDDKIGGIEDKVSKTFDTKVEDLFTKLKDPESKELYALSAMLLWRFLAVMEEPDIKKVIHNKIIGYTKSYGPQFFEAIKGEAAKQYPILEQIPQGVGVEDPNAWMNMIPEEYRDMVQGFMPFLQLMKMGKK